MKRRGFLGLLASGLAVATLPEDELRRRFWQGFSVSRDVSVMRNIADGQPFSRILPTDPLPASWGTLWTDKGYTVEGVRIRMGWDMPFAKIDQLLDPVVPVRLPGGERRILMHPPVTQLLNGGDLVELNPARPDSVRAAAGREPVLGIVESIGKDGLVTVRLG